MAVNDLLQGKKILLVDDEADVLDTLEELLADYDTVRAATFEDARNLLETEAFDVAILDIMGVNGFELLAISARKGVISVMLTARAIDPHSIKRSITGGADYYLPKEEMSRIEDHLREVLAARMQGRSPWERWMHRLGSYCEKRFGPDWQKGDKIFWDKFPFH